MIIVSDILAKELEKAKKTLEDLNELDLTIQYYKEELQKDIDSIEMLLKRHGDSKLGQINSALDFIMKDLLQYAEKHKPKQFDEPKLIEPLTKRKYKPRQPKAVEEKVNDSVAPKKGKVGAQEIIDVLSKLFEENMDMIYSKTQMWEYLLKHLPRIKDKWKSKNHAIDFALKTTKHRIIRVGRNEYTYNFND